MGIKKGLRRKMWMIPLFMISVGVLVGIAIMSLWNWIMPTVFGLGVITFWQALGLMILGRLIFGGFRKHKPRGWGMRHQYAYSYCRHQNRNKDIPA